MSKISKEKLKVVVLQEIHENKELLFGAFSPTITHELKLQKWNEILELGKEINLFKPTDKIEILKSLFNREKSGYLVRKIDIYICACIKKQLIN